MNETAAKSTTMGFKKELAKFFFNQAMLVILIALIIIMSFISDNFLSTGNLFNIIRQVTVLGIMACGMTIVIIGKGIDLSAASTLALCAVVNVMLQQFGYIAAIIAAITTGIVCGYINGYLIGKVKANFVIVTLGTMIFYKGVALIISGGRNLKSRPEAVFHYIGDESILGIPVLAYFLVIVMVVFGILLHKTMVGRRLFATGLNDKAARVSGIDTEKIIMISYIINGFLIGVASIVLSSRLPRIRVGTASTYLFDVITIVVLGGTALSGGVGGIYKTAVGLMIFAIINNGMALMSIPFEFQQLFKGVILILAVLYDEFNRRKRLLY
jgi:ribose/xylose/arabinose/galactoside ABC-type transport system permease subunit